MVARLLEIDQAILRDAADKAMAATSAKISVVVASVSDDYYDFILLYGFIGGSVLGLFLWACGLMTDLPLLLVLQGAVIVAADALPWCRSYCVGIVPLHIRQQRGAREAMRQYQYLRSKLFEDMPFVELYVSLADRYVQVVTNPAVHKEIPANWDKVTNEFTAAARKQGVSLAAAAALKHIGERLAEKFPKN